MPRPVLPLWYRLAARARGVSALAGPLAIVIGTLGGLLLPDDAFPPALVVALGLGGFMVLLIGMTATFMPGAPALSPVELAPPVAGRWVAVNSPAERRPSHGTHGMAQTFALDLVHEPAPGERPAFGSGPAFRAPDDFPAFGQPVYAPADAVVHTVRDRARDHRSRSSRLAYGYLMIEGMLREFAGSRFVLGNHIVLALGGGGYAVLAHLKRGSIAVAPGDRVHSGQWLARCGNTGNSSEPHLHLQVMDAPRAFFAAGLPFRFRGTGGSGLPREGDALLAAVGES